MSRVTLLSAGTLHPWNVAGAGFDLLAAHAVEARVLTALAAVSIQDASGVRAVHALPDAVFAEQLASMPWDEIDGVRVGALPTSQTHETLHQALAGRDVPVVIDPVLVASTGGALADDGAATALRRWYGDPRAVVTPNRSEAAAMLGSDLPPHVAAAQLQALGARAVVVKGGHFAGDAVDIAADASGVFEVRSARIDVDMRGTGCLFAMALCASLARGHEMRDALAYAHAIVRSAISASSTLAGFTVAY